MNGNGATLEDYAFGASPEFTASYGAPVITVPTLETGGFMPSESIDPGIFWGGGPVASGNGAVAQTTDLSRIFTTAGQALQTGVRAVGQLADAFTGRRSTAPAGPRPGFTTTQLLLGAVVVIGVAAWALKR
ncbi:MAG TPA: hypothetical protein VGR44_12130 [Methylomirabilota bacterium]|jgi:hypothetical protein|nr:hypothetical protein [Methylomirabilota bacterium]